MRSIIKFIWAFHGTASQTTRKYLLVYVAVKVGLTDVTTKAMKRDSWNKIHAR